VTSRPSTSARGTAAYPENSCIGARRKRAAASGARSTWTHAASPPDSTTTGRSASAPTKLATGGVSVKPTRYGCPKDKTMATKVGGSSTYRTGLFPASA
jgi:hypothetical protein